MKAIQEKLDFKPVTLVLESQEEIDNLFEAVQMYRGFKQRFRLDESLDILSMNTIKPYSTKGKS